MMITNNFSWSEAQCKDGTAVPDIYKANAEKVAKNLQVIREAVGGPLHVLSWFRTDAHNKKVGGAKFSQHLTASAADLISRTLTPKELYDLIEKLIAEQKVDEGGLGLYKTFVHYDIRGSRVRWDLS